MNADESDRCLTIAKEKYRSGDINGAIKFTNKSISLHPSTEAKSFVKKKAF